MKDSFPESPCVGFSVELWPASNPNVSKSQSLHSPFIWTRVDSRRWASSLLLGKSHHQRRIQEERTVLLPRLLHDPLASWKEPCEVKILLPCAAHTILKRTRHAWSNELYPSAVAQLRRPQPSTRNLKVLELSQPTVQEQMKDRTSVHAPISRLRRHTSRARCPREVRFGSSACVNASQCHGTGKNRKSRLRLRPSLDSC